MSKSDADSLSSPNSSFSRGRVSFRGRTGHGVLRALGQKTLAGEGPIQFDTVLQTRAGMHFFLSFCSEEESAESLLFWLEARDYKLRQVPGIHRELLARKIYQRYIAPDAPKPISTSQFLQEKVHASLTSLAGPSGQLFDDHVAEVSYLLRYDVFPRFIRSTEYEQLASLTLEERMRFGIEQFDLLRFLGSGGFGMVLLGRKKDTSKLYAIKVIDKRIVLHDGSVHSIFREREVLSCVEHPFICGLRYAFQTEDSLCLAIEFVDGGNMYADLRRAGPYQERRASWYAAQVTLAIDHLHSLKILYRDLKPDNVLLCMNGYVKLADMGAARGLSESGLIEVEGHDVSPQTARIKSRHAEEGDDGQPPPARRRMTITGTHGYRAPEVYDREYGMAVDWWCVGLLIYEMLTCENPMRGRNRHMSEHLTKFRQLPTHELVGAVAFDIVERFLQKDPQLRLGSQALDSIQAHAFFGAIDWDGMLRLQIVPPFTDQLQAVSIEPDALPGGLSHFYQRVDFMREALEARARWQLEPDEQSFFADFDFASSRAIEDELEAPHMGRDRSNTSRSWRILPDSQTERAASHSTAQSGEAQQRSEG